MSWPCPNCHAQCRTPDAYDIHFKRCRAMSVEEIEEILKANHVIDYSALSKPSGDRTRIAKAIHVHHIAKLRGKKV